MDCVHNDTLKIAGGLGRTAGEAGDQDQEGAAEGEEGEDPSKAKKKPRVPNFITFSQVHTS